MLKPEERASIKEVAGFIKENEHTVGKILQRLVKSGIINSTKGPNGGFYISDKQRKMPVSSIVKSIDGRDLYVMCGLGFSRCNDTRPCPFHNDFKKVREKFISMCEQNKIYNLCEKVNLGSAFLNG
jgi:Rrf2 family protein